ncbi:hypothetical protein QBC32DRAFT_127884 [Pseudoneurospora amorphoporcata]|uniref:Uncharacterized protein n=1 Tax=Pseudoneurospora amorphoporcata TaxID=241081 RepID=A0AAN6SG65_9PEZI|nr:hypothetical protein QBC32DRAFT_127884 [Pseudoneurospora amorphoporcata]
MLLRLVPRGRVGGLFPGISPPSSQRASLALRGTTTTTTSTPNLKHHQVVQVNYYSIFKDKSQKNADRRTDFEKALPKTVKCLSVAVNPEAWDSYLSGGPREIYRKRMNPRNPRVFISPAIRNFYYKSVLSHGPELRADCLVILASLKFFQEVQCAHSFFFNTVNELFPRTEVGPLKDSEVLKDKLNVVTAVVDKIPLWRVPGYAPSATIASEGFSILSGRTEHLLPGLWENSDFSWSNMRNETDPLFLERMYKRLPVDSKGDANKVEKPMPYSSGPPPVLEFRINPMRGHDEPVQVTLPLANTSYATSTAAQQRGRGTTPHILEVSAWARSPEKQKLRPIHVEANTRTHVTIETTSLKQPWPSTAWFQLAPITSPRKIVSGLGNILKQVEIDGESAPASKELEDVIPKLLSLRASSQKLLKSPLDSHAVKVWALVIPDEVYQKFANLQPYSVYLPGQFPSPPFDLEGASTVDEKRSAAMCSATLQALLLAGCHIREILSGGGGWGTKQGLLSLDPQDRDSRRKTPKNNEAKEEEDEEDDMEGLERFLRTLRGEQNVGDIASPGSWVQFFVAPARLEMPLWDTNQSKTVVKNRRPAEKLTLGVADAVEEYAPAWDPEFTENRERYRYRYRWTDPNGVEIYTHQFGALANGSLWLDFKKKPRGESQVATAETETATKTAMTTVTEITENSTTDNSTKDINLKVNEQEEEEEEEEDLWKDLQTDSERKITVPEFWVRADFENRQYVAKQPKEEEVKLSGIIRKIRLSY